MTDTRKYIEEQFDQFFEFDTDDRSTVTSASCRFFAEHCIEQLLAVIAVKDEALKLSAAVFSGEISDKSGMIKSLELLREALAIKPENVELVEVGKVKEVGGSLFACQYSPDNGVRIGDILLTIKTKGGNDANFG